MAKFERHFAGEPLAPQTLPRAPAQQLADTGQGLEAQALAGVGGALTDVSAVVIKWYNREGNSQFDTARADVQDRIGEFERTSYANADNHDKGFKQLEADIEKLAPKNKSGASKFKAWTKLNKAGLDRLSAEKKIRFIARQNQLALFNNLSNVAKITDETKAMAEINLLIQGGLDDGSIKTANQALTMKKEFTENWLRADIWRRVTAIVRPDGEIDWSEAVEWFSQPENLEGVDPKIIDGLLSDAKAQLINQEKRDNDVILEQQEASRGVLNDILQQGQVPTPTQIEDAKLPEKEETVYLKWAAAETRRIEKGGGIVTNSKVRAQLYRDITHILTGAQTRNDVLKKAQEARFGESPTLDETDYQKVLTAMEAQYEQGYGQMMSKVNSYARGILLNPDSLGFIRNAPVRYKTLGDFEEKWLQWVASQGEKLKLADIYPEGRRLAASFQISDVEAERQETVMTEALEAKETFVGPLEPKRKTIVEQRIEGETITEYLKRRSK